jgi:hypothetical protein
MAIRRWQRRTVMKKRARLAYERAMRAHVIELGRSFLALGRGEVGSGELERTIERFHEEVMHERDAFYTDPDPENVLGWSVAHRVISEDKLSEDIARVIGRAAKMGIDTVCID